MALVSNPHSAYSPRLPWLGGIAGLLAGGAILYFWPQWNRTWLSLVPAPVSVYTRFLGCGEVIVSACVDHCREKHAKPYGTRIWAGQAVSARLVGK